jgi:nucleoside-diphosphate-sugar epimerase
VNSVCEYWHGGANTVRISIDRIDRIDEEVSAMNRQLHVVLGATGGAGRAIAQALEHDRIPTETVSRSGATTRRADLERPDDARRAVESAAVVYLAAQPPYTEWPDRFPPMVRNVIDACAGVGAKLVMVDNLYAYGSVSVPMTEDTHELATDAKGKVRTQMTAMLLDAHRAGRVRVAIGRASDYFGPAGDNSSITALVVEPAVAGKPARWVARLDMPHSLAYLPDIGRAYVVLGTSAEADGRIWHLPHPPAITGAAFAEALSSALGRPVPARTLSRAMLRVAAPFHGLSRETLGVIHQWDRPFVVDDARFRATFGSLDITPLDEAIATTVAWYRQRRPRP